MSWILSEKEIYLDDFTGLQPWLIAVLASLSRKKQGPRVIMGIKNPSKFAKALGFDAHFGIFQSYRHKEINRTVGLSHIDRKTNYEFVANEITNLLIKNIKKNLAYTDVSDLKDTVYYVLNELMRNVIQHSEDDSGGLLIAKKMNSGYYRDDKPCIQITVVDNGVGILKSLQRNHSIELADVALLDSIKPHFSGAFPEEQIGGTVLMLDWDFL